MKHVGLRYRAVLVAGISFGVFFLLAWMTEFYTFHEMEQRTESVANFLATPLNQVDPTTCRDHLLLISEVEPYQGFQVYKDDGTSFIEVGRGSKATFIEKPLRALRLIRDVPLSSLILYEGRSIGRLEALWINQNVYFYMGLLPLLATIALAIIVSHYLRLLKDQEQVSTLRWERERVKALESKNALAKTEARYKDLIEGAKDIIYECDLKGRFTYFNPIATQQLGYDTDTLLGSHFGRLLTSDNRLELVTHYKNQLAHERENSYREFQVLHGSGKTIWIGQNVQLVRSDGTVSGFQAVARDITELKNAIAKLAEREEHMDQEMQLARQIHRSLMPISIPKLQGFDFGLRFIPSGVIGGDFISFVENPNNPQQLGVFFADITGHGVAAALLSSMLKVLVDQVMNTGASPASCFAMLNKRISKEFPEGNFVSAFYAVFNRHQRSLTFVKASQEPGYLIRNNGDIEVLEDGGPALGLLDPFCFGDPTYEQETLYLQPGDTVFFYTDGLIELWDKSGNSLNPDVLTSWILEESEQTAQGLVDALYNRAIDFSGTDELPDDVAELAVRVLSD